MREELNISAKDVQPGDKLFHAVLVQAADAYSQPGFAWVKVRKVELIKGTHDAWLTTKRFRIRMFRHTCVRVLRKVTYKKLVKKGRKK